MQHSSIAAFKINLVAKTVHFAPVGAMNPTLRKRNMGREKDASNYVLRKKRDQLAT
jgi:hypothetical protein